MINHPNRSKVDKEATISDVAFFEGVATFSAQDRRWCYSPTRGRIYTNTVGEPVHQSDDGSYCLSNGQRFGEVLSHAHLLGANVHPVRAV